MMLKQFYDLIGHLCNLFCKVTIQLFGPFMKFEFVFLLLSCGIDDT